MHYKLIFYTSGSSNVIEDFISSLEFSTQAKILRSLDLIEKFGPRVGMPHVKKISRSLFELRIRGKQEVRLLFTQRETTIYFLHGFLKKSNKIARNEIKTANKRLTMI